MPFTITQRNLIYFLIGLLLLAVAFSRSEVFWELGWAGAWLYNLTISIGFLLVGYNSARLLGFRGMLGITVLVVAEAAVFAGLQWVIVQQPRNLPKIHLIKSVYSQIHKSLQYDTSLSRFDADLGYLYKPNIQAAIFENWEFGPHTYKTNSLGLRDDETSAQNPVVIALGDSYTSGWGVGQNETYANKLEQLSGVKVLNAGVSSYGTVREGLLLNRIPHDSCKLLIIQYCVNDFLENQYWSDSLLAGGHFKPTFNQENYRKTQIQNAAGTIYVPFKYSSEVCKMVLRYLFLPPDRFNSAIRDRTDAPLEHLSYFFNSIQLIRRHYKGNILVFNASNSKRINTDFIEEARRYGLKNSADNLYFLNTANALGPKDKYVIDGHYTASGHWKVAMQLHEFIKKNKLLTSLP